jgi:hypothetical protein
MVDVARRSIHWLHLPEGTCPGFLDVGCPRALQTACTAFFFPFPQDSGSINLRDFGAIFFFAGRLDGASTRYVVMYHGTKSESQVNGDLDKESLYISLRFVQNNARIHWATVVRNWIMLIEKEILEEK